MPLHDDLERIFRDVFGNDSIVLTSETTARDIPEWDSLGHINLMFALEDRFRVRFGSNELAELANVGELEHWLAARSDGASPGA
jgi:acyl carrier protein